MSLVAPAAPAAVEVPVGDLSHLNYRRFLPHPVLRPWVQCYWSAYLPVAPTNEIVERMYPDGGASITFNLPDCDNHWFSAKQSLHTLVLNEAIDSFGIRFHPAGAQWLIQVPIHEVNQHHIVLKDYIAAGFKSFGGIAALNDKLIAANSIRQRVMLVDKWLINLWQRLQPSLNLAQQVIANWSFLDSDIVTWCEQQRLSRRTVERAFKQYVGITPGRYKLLQQIRLARESIKQNPTQSLTDLSQALGFYDQAHFTRHFRSITGQTPGKYRERQLGRV